MLKLRSQLRSQLLSFAFKTERLYWAGLTQKRVIQLGLFAFLILGLLYRIWWLALFSVGLLVLFSLLYRWAGRSGYTTFVPVSPSTKLKTELKMTDQLQPDQKISIRGTGKFLIGDAERRLLFVSGECWQLPIGEVALMVEAAPGRFAYQFIHPKSVEQARLGHIWFNNEKEIGIEVTFQTDWIPADEQMTMDWQPNNNEITKKMGQRTIILSFDGDEDAHRVWGKLNGL